jgi:hypothetical protein
MGDDKSADARVFHIVQPRRTTRRVLPPLLRHLIVVLTGSTVALVSFYILRKMGY